MRKINFAIWVITVSLLCFIVLCSLQLAFLYLQLFFCALMGSLIWMVITILKNGEPSRHTFAERFAEDSDHEAH